MADLRLRFLGCGDAFASGGRFHTSFLLDGGAEPLLVDCGASALIALKRAGIDSRSVGFVVLSHLHGDHFGGLPWLILDGQFSGRTAPLVIAGPPETEDRFTTAFEALYPGSSSAERQFEVSVVELPERTPRQLGPAVVETVPVIHTPGTNPHGLRIEYGGKVVAYSGDTEWTEELVGLADGADLFVCECQAYDQEIPGHLNYRTLSEKREQLRCGRLVLTHMGEEMLARAEQLDVEVAGDGLVVTL